ncbi:MAG: hypothetical protein LBU61_01470 [Coriobacteriales bacterium]|jgi:hypothetical protein|nr:hypothetical protein [Coriobacteriales bacterium]
MSRKNQLGKIAMHLTRKKLSVFLVALLLVGLIPALPEFAFATDEGWQNQNEGVLGSLVVNEVDAVGEAAYVLESLFEAEGKDSVAATDVLESPGEIREEDFIEEDAYLPNDAEEVEPQANSVYAQSNHLFQLTIRTPVNGSTFILPTSSYLNGRHIRKYYNWLVDWGDGSTQYVLGESFEDSGIAHSYTVAGNYTISITPNGTTDAWLAAFGFDGNISDSGVNSIINRAMVIGVPSPLTPEMTRNTAQIAGTATAPDREWANSFYQCENLISAPVFLGWEGIRSVGMQFAFQMFSRCSNLSTLPPGFNLPENLVEVGTGFVAWMFKECESLTRLPDGFNLPQGITSDNGFFALGFLSRCTGLSELPEGFNLPQSISKTNYGFANNMFDGCTNIIVLPDGFNLPQGITDAGDYFAEEMFIDCRSLKKLPDGFNLPVGIVEAGERFANRMFVNCISLTALPEGFTLPQGLSSVGDDFGYQMFVRCQSLTGLPSGFNLPRSVISVGSNFAYGMFLWAGSSTFQINSEFTFPKGVPSNASNAYYRTFDLSDAAPIQNRTAVSIIGNSPTPDYSRLTFDDHFSDIHSIPINWGGRIFSYAEAGAPHSGDLFGTGHATMDVALLVARIAIGGGINLTEEQFTAVDMDSDGLLTMADVLLIMREASGL